MPKLFVRVVIDQLNKYKARYGEIGFNKLLNEGFNFRNANVNYFPSETAPGYTLIYARTPTSYHDIVSKRWYDQEFGNYLGNVLTLDYLGRCKGSF